MLDHHQECDSSLISLLTIDIACSSLQESDESGSRKVPRKPSGSWSSGVVEPVSTVFNTSFRYTSSWYTLWLVNCDNLLQHLRKSFGFARTEFNKQVEHWNPPTMHLLTFWHFDTRNSFSGWGGGGVGVVSWFRYLKRCSSFYLLAVNRSIRFCAHPHWPREPCTG